MSHLLHQLVSFLADYGLLGIFVMSAIDSAGVPLPIGIDVVLILLAAKHPEQAWLGAVLATVGSVAGNLFLFMAARKGGGYFVEHAPPPGGHSRFRRWFDRYGLMTVFIPALVPILPLPLKVFVVSAGALRMKLWHFLVVIVLARVARFFGEAYLGLKIGEDSMAFLHQHAWTLVWITIALAAAIYVLMQVAGRRRRAGPRPAQ